MGWIQDRMTRMRKLTLEILPGELAVAKLPADSPLPSWAGGRSFCCLLRTEQELTVVCPSASLPEGVEAESGWRAMQVRGPLPFEEVGILSCLSGALARAAVSIFALSSFSTDTILVPEALLPRACSALRSEGHEVLHLPT